MFARVTTTRGDPQRADEYIAYVNEKIRPAIMAQGALWLDFLFSRTLSDGYTISYWKDAAAASASAATANTLRAQSASDLSLQVLDVHTYEVTFEITPSGPAPRAARVTPASADIGRIDEITRWTETQLIPTYRAQPGFRGWHTLTDRQTGKSLIMSLWEDEAAMSAAEALLTQSRGRGTQEMGLQFEPTQRYELGAQPTPPSGQPQQFEARP